MASKGQKFKHWSKEENILPIGMIRNWTKLYIEQEKNETWECFNFA